MQRNNWIGLREKDNFAYTLGQKPIYSKDCKNSIIISDRKEGFVEGISNYALIRGNGKEYLISINEIEKIFEISREIIGEGNILYQKPTSILERESLDNLSKEFVYEKLFENYGILTKSINEIQTKKGGHRVYEIFSEEKRRYMLKYYGKDLDLFNAQINLLEGIPLFSRIIYTKDLNSHLLFGNSIYYLEEFVEGNYLPKDNKVYYDLVGKHLAFIHNEFNIKKVSTSHLERILNKDGNNFNESNLISMKMDLINGNNNTLLRKLDSMPEMFSQKLNYFPKQIIHGDLNKSNLIWKGDNFLTIDFETIVFSKRINEFIPTLLFEGNLSTPKYNFNSLKEILGSYNFYSKNKLTKDEIYLLPSLLGFSLIKSYDIYVIRRNLKDEKFKNQIISNLEILEEEENVH